MEWQSILSSVITSGVVTLAGGILVKAAIEKSVTHGFDRQLEKLKSDLRNSEGELQALRNSVVGRLSARNQQLDSRRLQAIEKIWSEISNLRKYSLAMTFTYSVDLTAIDAEMDKRGGEAEKFSAFASDIMKMSGLAENAAIITPNMAVERIYVSPKAWLAFQAIIQIVSRSILVLSTIRSGFATHGLLKGPEVVNDLVRASLPDMSEYLKKYPDNGAFYLLPKLEELVFSEFLQFTTGQDLNAEDVKAAVQAVRDSETQQPSLPVEVPESVKAEVPLLP